MKERIKKFTEQRISLQKDLRSWVKDRTIPLNERWDVFLISGLGDHSKFVPDFDSIDYDLFQEEGPIYISKYQFALVSDILEQALDNGVFNTTEQENNFKEEVLEKFLYSFIFNW